MSLNAIMSAHPSIQDLSSEAKSISHDTNPLAIIGYRLQVTLLAPEGRIGFSARWYSFFTEMHRCQDTTINLVEIVTARLIQRRAFIMVTSRRINLWGLNPLEFVFEEQNL